MRERRANGSSAHNDPRRQPDPPSPPHRLIDATKHPQIHGHPTICQTALHIAPVLSKEMMATPTISLAMMSLMQTLAKDDSPDLIAPRAALLKRLEEVATEEWLTVLGKGIRAGLILQFIEIGDA